MDSFFNVMQVSLQDDKYDQPHVCKGLVLGLILYLQSGNVNYAAIIIGFIQAL